ncbi:MAG: subclass B3 metallo-beta-lactamase [Gemmatimonadaceae bacterium]
MRSGSALLCIGLVLTSETMALAQNGRARDETASWYEPTEPARIVGPVYFVGTRGLSAYLVTTPQGHILLNGAMPKSAPLIEASIRKLGFKPEDIRFLLAGHAHIDHVGTHAYFKKLSGASVAMVHAEQDLIQSGGRSDFHYGHLEDFHFEPVAVDRVLHDGETIKLGDVAMTAILTPGHTRGSTTWRMTVRSGDRSYTVVFPDGTSINPGYRLVKEPSYEGIAADYRRSLGVLENLKPDIWLAPHTSFFDFHRKRARAAKQGASAWVDPVGYRRDIAERRRNYEKQVKAEESSVGLRDATWRLVRYQSGDGTRMEPEDRRPYTVSFKANGRATVRIDCNSGSGTWKVGGWNQIDLGPLALTRAACPAHPLTDRLARDWSSLTSYELRNGRLILSNSDKADRYEFGPAP